jgi:hypothetical protein
VKKPFPEIACLKSRVQSFATNKGLWQPRLLLDIPALAKLSFVAPLVIRATDVRVFGSRLFSEQTKPRAKV